MGVVQMEGNNQKGWSPISDKSASIPLMRWIYLDSSYFSLVILFILVIISHQGDSYQRGSSSSRQRWLQHQMALGSLDSPSGTDSPTTPPGTTEAATTLPPSIIGGTNPIFHVTKFPLNTSSSNSTFATPKPMKMIGNNTNLPAPNTTSKTFPVVARGNSGGITSYNANRNNYFGAGRRRIPLSYDGFSDGALFENNTSVNITVPLGDTAFLRCKIRNLGERSISWIRRRDWHILTSNKVAYTNDERFHVLHTEGTEDWTLQIKFVQKRDNGTYECQISTGTGIISLFVNLMVAVPEAFILGNGDEYHVEQGSTINLVCVIEKSPKSPEFIFWYHNDRMINYGSWRDVTVRTEPGLRTQSRLTIRDARIADSGNYTCTTAHAAPASITVFVSEASGLFSGDKIAAIQRRTNSNSPISSSSISFMQPVFRLNFTLHAIIIMSAAIIQVSMWMSTKIC